MTDPIYTKIKTELQAKPKQLTDMEQWLFVTVNTAIAMVDNNKKTKGTPHRQCKNMKTC